MSVLGTNTLWGGINSFYVPFTTVPANPANIGGTVAPATVAAISTIYTDHLSIDGIGLDGSSAGGGQLLINGVAVATVAQNVSSIANWAQYPALSSITYAGGGGTGGLINMATGTFSTLNAPIANITSLSTGSVNVGAISTTSISTGTIVAATGTVGTLSNAVFNTSTINASTITSVNGNVFNFATPTGSISTLNVSSINGVKPVLSLANWALLPALSTISYTAPGGAINMNAGSFSTLNGAALNVSSINGVPATNAIGVYQAFTQQHSVLADSANPNAQTLSFANDKPVSLTAGNWYIISATVTWSGNNSQATQDRFQIAVANIGGNIYGPQVSQTYYALQQVTIAQNGVSDVTNQYYYTTMVRAGATGTATLQIIATYPGMGGIGNTWLSSQFNITPLGGNLN